MEDDGAIAQWMKSSVERETINEMRVKAVILEEVEAMGWRIPSRTEVEPRPKDTEVVSFTDFHYFGFGLLGHPLLKWLLHYYGLRLHDLTPEGILHLSVFILQCEGFLGVPAHHVMWRYLFEVRRSWNGARCPRMGGASIQLHTGMEDRYLRRDRYHSTDMGW
jgi:hypothetical protein